METLALLSGMVVILMIGAPYVSISSSRICLDGFQPSEVWQIMNDRKESFVGDIEGVSLTCYCCWPIRLLLIFLNWFEGLELLASLFLVEPLVTKTY